MASAYLQEALGKEGACHVFRHTAATLMHEAGADIRIIQELRPRGPLEHPDLHRVSIQRLKEVHSKTHPARLTRSADRDEPAGR